jgi:phage anti-repressor protein
MDNIFVGSGKEKFDGNLINVTINLSDIPKEWIFEYNNKKYVKINVKKKKQPDQYGKTYSVSIDTWKPTAKVEAKQPVQQIAEQNDNEPNDLPF